MRFVSIDDLKDGMVLARDVNYREVGKPIFLLRKDEILNEKKIKAFNHLNLSGVFIVDNDGESIQYISILDQEIKEDAVDKIKSIFEKRLSKKVVSESIESLMSIVDTVIDNILSNNELKVGIVDLKAYDDYTYHHSLAVSVLAIAIASEMGMERKDLCRLGIAGMLHDIGKAEIDKNITNKPGKLDVDEMILMRHHPVIGGEFILENHITDMGIYEGVINHHERWDGRGYPFQLAGKEIPLFARILAVADVYDALTSNRSYRRAKAPSEAYEYILGGAESHFDLEVVQAFTRSVEPYPIGSCILLSNDDVCMVIKNFRDFPLRPLVRSIYSEREYDLAIEINTMHITVIGEFDGMETIDEVRNSYNQFNE